MKQKVIPFGTTMRAQVLQRERTKAGTLVMLLKDEHGEGQILVGCPDNGGEAGDHGTMEFIRGGPLGGFWVFRPDKTGEQR